MSFRSMFAILATSAAFADSAAGQAAVTAESTKPIFALTISTPANTVKRGAEIAIEVSLKNTSSSSISINAFQIAVDSYMVEVLDSAGNSAPLTEYGRVVLKGERYQPRGGVYKIHMPGGGNARVFRLEPGGTARETLSVSDLFDMSRPGTYTIQVQRGEGYTVKLSKGPIIKSNTITVTVTQ